jgi:hypothetical protein
MENRKELIDDIVQGKITEFLLLPLVLRLYKKAAPTNMDKR